MNNKIEIRKVKAGDEKILAYIQTESWKKAFFHILTEEELVHYTNISKAEEMYADILSQGFGKGFILFIDGTPQCMAYWNATREKEMQQYAELICIHSLQDKWGHGYGSMMMKHILNEVKQAKYTKIMLWVFEDNERAKKFYEKHGFTLINKNKMFGSAREVMYVKDILPSDTY